MRHQNKIDNIIIIISMRTYNIKKFMFQPNYRLLSRVIIIKRTGLTSSNIKFVKNYYVVLHVPITAQIIILLSSESVL